MLQKRKRLQTFRLLSSFVFPLLSAEDADCCIGAHCSANAAADAVFLVLQNDVAIPLFVVLSPHLEYMLWAEADTVLTAFAYLFVDNDHA